MVIDDIIKIIHENNMAPTAREREFVSSVMDYIGRKNYITEKQSNYLLSIIGKCFNQLIEYGIHHSELNDLLAAPKYNIDVVERSGPTVTYAGNGVFVFKKFFKLQDNYDFQIIRSYSYGDRNMATYDRNCHHWVVKVTKSNYMKVMEIIKQYSATYTDEVLHYLNMIDECYGEEYEFSSDETMFHIDFKDDIFMNDMAKDIF